MKFWRIMTAAIAMAVGFLAWPGAASAHHPVLSQTTARPCGVAQPWSGTFTARSDADWNKDWRSKWKLDAGSYSAFSAWTDDQVPFGPINVGPFPATTASVTVTVYSEWKLKSATTQNAAASRSITLYRPASTSCDGGSPVAPVVTPPTCSAPGSVAGVNTASYTWSYSGSLDARVATATANPGYALTGQTVFGPYNVAQLGTNDPSCLAKVTPAAPQYTPPTCTAGGTLNAPDTDTYTWTLTGPDNARIATATARAGYTLEGQTVYGPYDLTQLAADSETCFVPCEWDPSLPAGAQECVPTIVVVGICYEVNADTSTWGYWYEVTNGEATSITIAWDEGRSATLAGNQKLTIDGHASGLTISVGGKVAAIAAAPDSTRCERDVTFTKDVQGPAPGADTKYTIKVSRLVPGEGAEGYVEETTFTLLDNETKTIPLPSTFNAEGISYQIEEIDAGGASRSAVTPNSFVANGHKGESISVTIVNSFASVEIVKSVSATAVVPGQELTYGLDVTNTGALTLNPVVVDDRLPDMVSYLGYEVAGGAGTCVLTEPGKPQLVTCTLAGALAPGAKAPTITLLVKVDAGLTPSAAIVNQARVRGNYAAPVPAGAGNALTQATSDLSCEPTENEVCDLSSRIGSTVTEATTTTAPTTTVAVGQQAVATTLVTELPKTGSNGTGNATLIGLALILSGLGVAAVARRPRTA